ncbi:DegQ family serine endoprotease [Geobacter pelophilus]|uniref:Probable periplasmic serine endoprotease DegP-like n=2 Tax=Geoanaerobacter pelophilus TaxID=60036 RepID=A0AAW4LCD3_9BACT|nr:DegQ family serine endoprotease [Geoanaerobacter pelophilus]
MVTLSLAAALTVVLPVPNATAKFTNPDFVELAKRLTPSVVNISTAKSVAAQRRLGRPFSSPFGSSPFDDFFDRFFDEAPQRQQKQRSLGSGFIISKDGLILTNNHVVDGADEIKVKLNNGKEYKAEIKGRDQKLDLALIKISAEKDLPSAELGESDSIEIGEWVMAIGNPFGLSETVTVGIVSAKGRVIGSGPYDDFIQTDASINPGNSGGPLFNARGEVVGINTAIIAGGQGIGFAIPVNMAKAILPQLKDKGAVTRGWLGVQTQGVTPEIAKSYGLTGEKGALVADIIKDTPAEKAGLKSGDIITEFDGKPVRDPNDLSRTVAATPPGKTVSLKLFRDGSEQSVAVTLERRKDDGSDTAASGAVAQDKLGLSVQELTRDLANSLRLKDAKGVVVSDVKPGGIADEAGIMRGDILLEINDAKIHTVQDYEKTVKQPSKGGYLRFRIRRGDTALIIAMKIDQ